MVDFINDVLPRLQTEEYFKQFKFIKKYISLRQKADFGFYNIEFCLHKSYDLERDEPALQIYPVYGIRLDILSKWFEKYSFKTISDQRNNSTVYADGNILGKQDKFYFFDSAQGFECDYFNFKERVISISSDYFSKYNTIKDFYINDVFPVLNKERAMSDVGADWIFEYLAAVKLCQFERYDEMVDMLKEHIKFMNSRKEPNIAMYNALFDNIFQELRTLSLGK